MLKVNKNDKKSLQNYVKMLSSGKLFNFYIQNYVFFLLKSVNIFFHNKTDKNRHQRRDDWNLKWKVD